MASAILEDFNSSGALLKFSRYQTQAERSLYRVLNELTRLQLLRRRKEAIQAQALDLETSIDGLNP
ncbi:MAG: hypothetical protein ABFD91_05640 [Anaerohalosphaeraceae bacterium]